MVAATSASIRRTIGDIVGTRHVHRINRDLLTVLTLVTHLQKRGQQVASALGVGHLGVAGHVMSYYRWWLVTGRPWRVREEPPRLLCAGGWAQW